MTNLLDTHAGSLQLLADVGFPSPQQYKKVVKGIEGVIEWCNDFEKKRDDLPFEIDGMVVKVNDLELQDKMGMTTHHPRWAIAYKFKARQATSKLKAVEFQTLEMQKQARAAFLKRFTAIEKQRGATVA